MGEARPGFSQKNKTSILQDTRYIIALVCYCIGRLRSIYLVSISIPRLGIGNYFQPDPLGVCGKSINQSNQQSPRLNFGSPPPKLIKSSHPLACCVLLRLASTRPFEKPRHTTAESTSPPPQPKSVLYGFTAGWRSVHLNSNRQLDSRPPSRLLRCERKGRYRFRSSFDLHSFTH